MERGGIGRCQRKAKRNQKTSAMQSGTKNAQRNPRKAYLYCTFRFFNARWKSSSRCTVHRDFSRESALTHIPPCRRTQGTQDHSIAQAWSVLYAPGGADGFCRTQYPIAPGFSLSSFAPAYLR